MDWLAFGLGYLVSWPSLILLSFGTLFLDHFDRGFLTLVFGAVIAYILFHMFGPVSSSTLVWFLALYFPIGVVWSFWRYKRWADALVDNLNEAAGLERLKTRDILAYEVKKKELIQDLKQELSPKRNISKLVYWILVWPISLLSSLLGDLIDLVKRFIVTWCNRIYDAILQRALARLA